MTYKVVTSLAMLAMILAGCSHQQVAKLTPAPQDIDPGMTFTVTRDFLIPGGDTSVYFQNTILYPQGDVHGDDPVCQFVVPAATASGQVISSRVFMINNISYNEDGVGPRGEDATVTQMSLRDKSGGQTFVLKCMLPKRSHGARPVTRGEIQGALGDYMLLKLPK